MRGIIFSVLIVICVGKLQAQNYELDKVTKEQLLQKAHPTDTSACAAILFKKAHTKLFIPKKMDFLP